VGIVVLLLEDEVLLDELLAFMTLPFIVVNGRI
jgi:hypothetical protein